MFSTKSEQTGGRRSGLRIRSLVGVFLHKENVNAEDGRGQENSDGLHHVERRAIADNGEAATVGVTDDDGNNDGTTDETTTDQAAHGPQKACTAPAYHEFPSDLFTSKQRKQGAVIIHAVVVVYMFIALAIVCDIYFVSSLDKICEKLHMSEDVAGATFMAAGSSAPELFTSIIGVFIAKGDVGVGTIVGSAVFNILFVIGICGVLIAQVIPLSWFPFARDSLFYSLSVILLIISLRDSMIQWYEATIMLLVYVAYIIFMKYNQFFQDWALAHVNFPTKTADDTGKIIDPSADQKYYGPGSYEMFTNDDGGHTLVPREVRPPPVGPAPIPIDEYANRIDPNRKISFQEASFRFLKRRPFPPKTRFKAVVCLIVIERRRLLNDPSFMHHYRMAHPGITGYQASDIAGWENWFMVTFLMSIVWIAFLSYIMVWMVCLIGYTLGIPDSIMGITFLAAGTSVPDCMASVMVARQGMGDMAVSNTIGSNVFDILIGLALPWFIQTAMVAPGSKVHINSNGMVFSVIILFLTVIITICSIHFNGWKLDKRLGIVCLISYAVFISISMMIEFNVFGYVNPPMCMEGTE